MNDRFLFSTTAPDAVEVAHRYGLGLELADFCTASNMDEPDYSTWGIPAIKKLDGFKSAIFHAPFNELSPAAIDPLILDIAYRRLKQAAELSMSIGIRSMVVHSGYIPLIYYKSWQHERSVIFWRELLKSLPDDFFLNIENVMEDTPEMIPDIVSEVNDPRLGICIDIGHANASSDIPAEIWIEKAAPHLRHMHLHNNDGAWDTHSLPDCGTMDVASLMRKAHRLSPSATMTFEVTDAAKTAEWLIKNKFI